MRPWTCATRRDCLNSDLLRETGWRGGGTPRPPPRRAGLNAENADEEIPVRRAGRGVLGRRVPPDVWCRRRKLQRGVRGEVFAGLLDRGGLPLELWRRGSFGPAHAVGAARVVRPGRADNRPGRFAPRLIRGGLLRRVPPVPFRVSGVLLRVARLLNFNCLMSPVVGLVPGGGCGRTAALVRAESGRDDAAPAAHDESPGETEIYQLAYHGFRYTRLINTPGSSCPYAGAPHKTPEAPALPCRMRRTGVAPRRFSKAYRPLAASPIRPDPITLTPVLEYRVKWQGPRSRVVGEAGGRPGVIVCGDWGYGRHLLRGRGQRRDAAIGLPFHFT